MRGPVKLVFCRWLPPIRVIGTGWDFVLRLLLLSVIVAFERLVEKALLRFLQLDIRLCSG